MLIDYFCNTYLACLKISKNTVDSVVFNTYKSNVTKSGVDILFMLFRHTTVAYFATKKVFLKENNITKETLNNLLNLTPYCYMLDISNKRVLDEFFNMMKLALMMQNINKDKVESIIDTIKEDKKGID